MAKNNTFKKIKSRIPEEYTQERVCAVCGGTGYDPREAQTKSRHGVHKTQVGKWACTACEGKGKIPPLVNPEDEAQVLAWAKIFKA
jgi:RecJ-like exonuclease